MDQQADAVCQRLSQTLEYDLSSVIETINGGLENERANLIKRLEP